MEGKIIIRYGCDGCAKLFENKKDLNEIVVKQLRNDGFGRFGITFVDRRELLCDECLTDRDNPQKAPVQEPAPVRGPVGFRQR